MAAQELATLKPGVVMPEVAARSLLNEEIVSVDEARRWQGKGAGRKVTFKDVAACSGGHWGWYVAVSRRNSSRSGQRGFRSLVAGPFGTRERAKMRCRELRKGRCLAHADCSLDIEMAVACLNASQRAALIRSTAR